MLTMLLYPTAAAALAVLLALAYDPERWHGRLLRALTAGIVLVWLWDLTPLPHIGLNLAAALTSGTLGLPGLLLLAAAGRIV